MIFFFKELFGQPVPLLWRQNWNGETERTTCGTWSQAAFKPWSSAWDPSPSTWAASSSNFFRNVFRDLAVSMQTTSTIANMKCSCPLVSVLSLLVLIFRQLLLKNVRPLYSFQWTDPLIPSPQFQNLASLPLNHIYFLFRYLFFKHLNHDVHTVFEVEVTPGCHCRVLLLSQQRRFDMNCGYFSLQLLTNVWRFLIQ